MAEIIPDLDRHTDRRTKYPWHEWTDGQARRIRQGEDYTLSEYGMRNALKVHATRKKLRVSVREVPEEAALDFQFYKRDEETPAA